MNLEQIKQQVIESFAHKLARARCPDVKMSGRHNPLPREVRTAEMFFEDHVQPLVGRVEELEAALRDLACPNCDDRLCMGCVLREWDHKCADDCPTCCPDDRSTYPNRDAWIRRRAVLASLPVREETNQ